MTSLSRRLALVLGLMSGLFLFGVLTTGIVAQPPSKPPVKEEEEEEKKPTKPTQTKPKKGEEEEEEEVKKPAKSTTKPKTGEEEEDSSAKKPAATGPKKVVPPPDETMTKVVDLRRGPFNLAEEANQASHPAMKKLLSTFAKPADVITAKSSMGGTKEWEVEPLARRYDPASIVPIDYITIEGGRKGKFEREQIVSVVHFEQRALSEVRKFLDSGLDRPDASGKSAVSRFDMLRTAEKVLYEVLSFHEKAKSINIRAGSAWDAFGPELEKELFQIQIAEIRALTADQDWNSATALSQRLYNERPGERELLATIEATYSSYASHLLDTRQDFLQARKLIETIKNKYKIDLPYGHKVQRRLEDRAREQFNLAKRLIQEGKRTEALKHLEDAAQAWPALAGLQDFILSQQMGYPVLKIGVRHLPVQMAPTTAASDIEKAVTRLMFEPILQLRAGPSMRDGYFSKFGEDPRRVDQGWEWTIPDGLMWSDGTPVTSTDVLRSSELVTVPGSFGSPLFNPDTNPTNDPQKVLLKVTAGDARTVRFSFSQAMPDPLAWLTFDLLPVHRLSPDRSPRDPAFGRSPVGTGPFVFKGMDGEEMIFMANPHFQRPHAPNGPNIKEIRLIQYNDLSAARQALSNGRWHMLLDLTTQDKEDLTGVNNVSVITPTAPSGQTAGFSLDNPRVYFLAPNFRKPIFQNENFRKALGLSINREGILNSVFRGQGAKHHASLTGPFPENSWASMPTLSPSQVATYQTTQASNFISEAEKAPGFTRNLTLLYPQEDAQAALACEQIRIMVNDAIRIRLDVRGVPHAALAAELSKESPNFDLVYWSYDFPNEMLSIFPLFDRNSVSPAGQNFMGNCNDTELMSIFSRMQSRRDLGYIQRQQHELHNLIWRKMLIIPLWQIDRHVAVHRSLQFPRLHPTYIFEDTELWRIKPD